MKKYFYNIMFAFIGALAFTACSEESGTEPEPTASLLLQYISMKPSFLSVPTTMSLSV